MIEIGERGPSSKVSPQVQTSYLRYEAMLSHEQRPAACAFRPFERAKRRRLCLAQSSLEGSCALARARAEHSQLPNPLFSDPYAAALAAVLPSEKSSRPAECAALVVVATRYIDEQLLTALNLVNMDLKQEYRQVVLLGCGMDTRPFRLLWPEGTLLFEIAPTAVHKQSRQVLMSQQAHVPRGCLLRRVSCDLQAGQDFSDALQRAGFQADRLSVWGIQGLEAMRLAPDQLRDLFTRISLMAAFDSLVLGELPPMTRQEAEEVLGEHSMLGRLVDFGDADADFGFWSDKMEQAIASGVGDKRRRRMFTSQHKQLSAKQVDVYASHMEAAEDTDEDFFGNFS